MELGYLAALVATMPGWLSFMIGRDEIDLNGPDENMRTAAVQTTAALLALLDEGLAKSRDALNRTTDDHLNGHWKIRMGDQVLAEGPRHSR